LLRKTHESVAELRIKNQTVAEWKQQTPADANAIPFLTARLQAVTPQSVRVLLPNNNATDARGSYESKGGLRMSLKKHYGKNNCSVTFLLPREAVGSANAVHLVGDFNEWDHTATPMTKNEDGEFVVTLTLEHNMDYQFRYLIDDWWENDSNADRYEQNQYGVENSVVAVELRSNDST